MSTAITEVQTAVAEFDKVAAGIAALEKQFKGVVYDVGIGKGMEAAKEARAAIREPRYEIERVRKAAKAPILALGKELDGRAKQITDQLLAIEEPIAEQIKNEEERKEREKQAKIEAEIARIAAIDARIDVIRNWPAQYAGKPSSLVSQQVQAANDYVINDFFAEKSEQAQTVLETSRLALNGLLAERLAHEAEQVKLAAEREELARLRADQAKRDEEAKAETARLRAEEEKRNEAERARIREEERVAREARDAESAKVAEANRVRQAEIAKQEAEHAARVKADNDRIAAERAEVERQQAAIAEAAKPKARKKTATRPTDHAIVSAVATQFGVQMPTAIEWILTVDFSALSQDAA